MASTTSADAGASLFFPPELAMHVVKIACELPEKRGRSLSQWDSVEIAAQLVREGLVTSISAATVWRILTHHKLKPWRVHAWLSPKVARDAEFMRRVRDIGDLYTRDLADHEMVLCVDEMTNLQPRPRSAATKPARAGEPVLVEHEYKRAGALNLFAAFDTRSGRTYAATHERKRQVEFIAFMEELDEQIPAEKTVVHVVLDNLSVHHGKLVRAWLEKHPRFVFHFTPVHCSWMNQVEQWFSIVKRKRLRVVNFTSKAELAQCLMAFVAQWNEDSHPFNWSEKSVAKVMAKCEYAIAA
jgi:transposase